MPIYHNCHYAAYSNSSLFSYILKEYILIFLFDLKTLIFLRKILTRLRICSCEKRVKWYIELIFLIVSKSISYSIICEKVFNKASKDAYLRFKRVSFECQEMVFS